jgi:hypothetical protein
MNYAEEAAYWYLRLNGFFAITNFVVHKSEGILHTSDCDVLAVRLPYVFEEVGGQDDDWDRFLLEHLDLAKPIGIVCEVKSGRYNERDLFRDDVLRYAIARLGFVPRATVDAVAARVRNEALIVLEDGAQIAKLLVARRQSLGPYLMRELAEVERFLQERVRKYPRRKFADRMFFGAVLFQTIIDQTAGNIGTE